MNCSELDPLIYPYLDGELDETERGHLEGHVAACVAGGARLSREAAFRGPLAARRACSTRPPAPAPAPRGPSGRCSRADAAGRTAGPSGWPGPGGEALRSPRPRAWCTWN